MLLSKILIEICDENLYMGKLQFSSVQEIPNLLMNNCKSNLLVYLCFAYLATGDNCAIIENILLNITFYNNFRIKEQNSLTL